TLYRVICGLAWPSSNEWSADIVLVITRSLLYFLLLLAYRAYPGRGRKSDGGLLPPWAMLGFIHTFGVVAAVIVFFGIVQGRFLPIVGGIAYLLSAYGALAAVRARRKDGE